MTWRVMGFHRRYLGIGKEIKQSAGDPYHRNWTLTLLAHDVGVASFLALSVSVYSSIYLLNRAVPISHVAVVDMCSGQGG